MPPRPSTHENRLQPRRPADPRQVPVVPRSRPEGDPGRPAARQPRRRDSASRGRQTSYRLGHAESSELIRRISAADTAELMPPPSSNRILSDEDKATLKAWIDQGAEYKQHWAFVKPTRPPIPHVRQSAWPKNPIDNFILAKLEDEGLKPALEADKDTLLRRVTLDLTGLPPTLAELHAFRADHSPKAYEKVVDRLLASPRYGERMAMELARLRTLRRQQRLPKRLRALPVALARLGDRRLQPQTCRTTSSPSTNSPATCCRTRLSTSIIATGFNRNNRTNSEGGAIPDEWLTEYVIDRVETTTLFGSDSPPDAPDATTTSTTRSARRSSTASTPTLTTCRRR